ncbi:MAG: HAD family hydrolase [Deltaproteobacteria bacterium]
MKGRPVSKITTIGFDADDTLWQNERFFRLSQERFFELLKDHADSDDLDESLMKAERRNIQHYGFGIKGFTLSMIETALEVTDNRVPTDVIAQLIALGKDMLAHPIELLPHVGEVVEALASSHKLVMITKGDLLHQEQKLARSGLGLLFRAVEIVSEKYAKTYTAAFREHGTGPDEAMMVGNSLKSDVIPALEAGAWAVHVPHHLEWSFEHAEAPVSHPRFRAISNLSKLPELVEQADQRPK